METLKSIILGTVNVAVVLALVPLFEGLVRKLTARIQSRQGPPIFQPYLDLLKLLGKEDIESGVSPGMQRFASYLSLASILTVATLIPMGARAPMSHSADAVMLIYLLTLCGISTLLGALAAGSTYSLVGMSREMMTMMTLEPILAVAVVLAAVQNHTLSLAGVFTGQGSFYVSGWLMLGVVLAAMQAFAGRLPFDIAEAETEIMEGPIMEYSGPKLALFKLTQMAKLFVYSALVAGLFFPWNGGTAHPVQLLIMLVKVLLLVVFVTVVAAAHGRYRIDQALKYYAGLFALAIVALLIAFAGY